MNTKEYFSKTDLFSVDEKVFNLAILFIGIISVYGAINVFIMSQPLIIFVLWLINIVILFGTFYLGINKKIRKDVKSVIVAYIVFICFPIIWFLSGGTKGTGLIYMGLFVVIASICFNKRTRDVFLPLLIIIVLSLIIFEYKFAYVFYEYPSEFTRLIDISISAVMVIVFMSILISNYVSEINYIQSNTVKYSKELVQKNKELQQDNKQVEKLYSYFRDKNEVLQDVSARDQLTGVYNRRYIMIKIKKEMHYAIKTNTKLSIIMIDIDEFKYINDRYGHQTGDIIIKETAKAMKDGLNGRGVVGRYGGDEFIAVIPRHKLERAAAIGKEIAKRIKKIEVSGKNFNVKFSGGVAEYYGEDINTFIDRADKLLYIAKKSGKDRIEM